MPRIIFVNRFYWPDEPATSQLLNDLAIHLARGKGRAITVIASRTSQAATPAREIRDQVSIIRVGTTRWGKYHPIARLADFLSFILGSIWQLLRTGHRGDLVVFMTDPPLLAALAWPLLKCRGIKFAHWVQDIYPEIAIELTGQRWLKFLTPIRNIAWRQAAACITLGEGMAKVISDGGVAQKKISIIPNWAPAGVAIPAATEVDALRQSWGLIDKFVILYSGNLGRVHDLEPIIQVAAALKDYPEIIFVFVGGGAQTDHLKAEVQVRGLPNVRFFPAQPRTELAATLALGDIHFVTLRPECHNYVFPSKFYGIVAAGRPVCYIGPKESELARVISLHQLGYGFTATQIPEIASTLRMLQSDSAMLNSFTQTVARFTAEHNIRESLQRWDDLLDAKLTLAARDKPRHVGLN